MQAVDLNAYFPHIKEVPSKLFIRGTLPPPEYKRITIVGSRKPSVYGVACVRRIISELAGFPVTIISGLALGTDTIVHEEALKSRIHTIALPGSGLLDAILYPSSNVNLAQRILSASGTLLSLWDTQRAAPWTFPVRNRIMAGLADLVIIIEAQEESGTMITARAAETLCIPLGAVPGNIDAPLSTGPNKLIKGGAYSITSGKDIIDLLHISCPQMRAQLKTSSRHPLLQHLDAPLHRDALAQKANLMPHELNAQITLLELEGVVTIDAQGILRKT